MPARKKAARRRGVMNRAQAKQLQKIGYLDKPVAKKTAAKKKKPKSHVFYWPR